MSSFFTIPPAQRKRKRSDNHESQKKRATATRRSSKPSKPPRRKPRRDESISGSESEDENLPSTDADPDRIDQSSLGSDGEEETAAERRLKLAEGYLDSIREQVNEVGFNAEDIDRDLIAERLKEDVAESKGRLYRNLAAELSFPQASHTLFRSNSETVTSIATCPPYAYTVSKDLWLIKWRIQDLPVNQFKSNGKKNLKNPPPPRRRPEKVAYAKGNKNNARDASYKGHTGAILSVAASQDGKFVVTGGRDKRIIVWDAESLKPLKVFAEHRDAVIGLAFRRGTNQLYSASRDRTIKVWSLDKLAYVETLFGHQDEVVDVAALAQERCVSVGARDRTGRLWKVVEETQLVFRGSGGEKKSRKNDLALNMTEGSIDRVALIDEDMFVTGSDNGSLSLWATHRKKPIFTLPFVHGIDDPMKPEECSGELNPDPSLVPVPQPRWITALATIPYSDVILSGSWDGHIRAWKVSEDKKRIEPLGVVGAGGFEDSQISSSQSLLFGSQSFAADHDSAIGMSNSLSPSPRMKTKHNEDIPTVRGVVNDISVFERGERGKDGVCILVALGKEHRLGRWMKHKNGKNGAVVFEVPRIMKTIMNGVSSLQIQSEESA
jgi:ribosomal RNA-processing protein 9